MSIIDFINSNPKLQKAMDELDEAFGLSGEDIEESSDSPMSVVIKPEALDTSKLKEGEGNKKFEPIKLDDFVGQEEAKSEILTEIKGCKENNEPFSHTFISAPAGHGKTVLANIIGKMIGKKVVFTTGGQLKSEQQFVDKINECEGGVILIDEANKIPTKVGFFMLPTIEKFKIDDKDLQPFTIIFMTTHKGDLSKDLDALIQRCDVQLELNHYKKEELITIIKQYKDKQYPDKKISENIYKEIANNCKYTPRIAKTLLRKYIFNQDWKKVLTMNKIVKEGLVEQDIRALKYLNEFEKGASKQTLANYLRVKPQTYEFEIEPYLIFKQFIKIEGKRKISEKGKDFLKCLK